MPEGKHFFIKSHLNDLVLDVEGGSRDPGTRVVTWFQKPDENDNQLWYEDHLAGTIRSLQSNLCLDINNEGSLVIAEYDEQRDTQQWVTSGDRVQRRQDSQIVLDICEEKMSEGATIIAYQLTDGQNQRWSFEYTSAKFFHIRSVMHGKVLDIKNRDTTAGTKAVMMTQSDSLEDSQLWYEDRHGVISSKLNNFVLDSGDDGKIRVQPWQAGTTTQLWTVQGDRIVNRVSPTQVLDICEKKKKDGAKLISYNWNSEENQRWQLDFV